MYRNVCVRCIATYMLDVLQRMCTPGHVLQYIYGRICCIPDSRVHMQAAHARSIPLARTMPSKHWARGGAGLYPDVSVRYRACILALRTYSFKKDVIVEENLRSNVFFRNWTCELHDSPISNKTSDFQKKTPDAGKRRPLRTTTSCFGGKGPPI